MKQMASFTLAKPAPVCASMMSDCALEFTPELMQGDALPARFNLDAKTCFALFCSSPYLTQGSPCRSSL